MLLESGPPASDRYEIERWMAREKSDDDLPQSQTAIVSNSLRTAPAICERYLRFNKMHAGSRPERMVYTPAKADGGIGATLGRNHDFRSSRFRGLRASPAFERHSFAWSFHG